MIYIICGQARTGKDLVAKIIKKNTNNSVVISITHPLKEYAKILTDWDGNDETKPRDFLQDLGINVIKNKIDQKFLVKRIIEDIKVLSYYKENIIVTGIRLKEEIDDLKKSFKNIVFIKIERNNFDNKLTSKQKEHVTEKDLLNYKGDYVIINEDANKLEDQVLEIIRGELNG